MNTDTSTGTPATEAVVQERKNEAFIPLTQTGGAKEYRDEGWSWGAFFLGPFFLFGIRKYSLLSAYLLMLVPFLNIIFMIGMMVYLGASGRTMARESKTFSSHGEYLGFMKGIDHGAKLSLILAAIFLIGVFLFISFVFSAVSRSW